MMNRSFIALLLVGLLSSFTGAFVPKSFSRPELRLQAVQQSPSVNAKIAAALTIAAINIAPLAALAEGLAEEDYEYGAVDAPIGIAVAGGIVAILTALLPVVMKGGAEAFEEMKDRDADAGSFGKNKDVLNGRKK
jgi:hypothetical protein